jgi:hypothetical protein
MTDPIFRTTFKLMWRWWMWPTRDCSAGNTTRSRARRGGTASWSVTATVVSRCVDWNEITDITAWKIMGCNHYAQSGFLNLIEFCSHSTWAIRTARPRTRHDDTVAGEVVVREIRRHVWAVYAFVIHTCAIRPTEERCCPRAFFSSWSHLFKVYDAYSN